MSMKKYGEPLAEEISSKVIAYKRRLSADLYGDGTGVQGTVSSSTVSSGAALVVLKSGDTDRGHVGFFEFDDLLVGKQQDATANTNPTVSSGTFTHWAVKDKDIVNGTVTLEARDANEAVLTVTNTQLNAADVFYRSGQTTLQDLTGIGSADFNTLTEIGVGLEALAANDGRVVHGITMSGATAGSVFDAGANPLDVSHIQRSMSVCKTRVGSGRYSYNAMIMSPAANDAFIESRETDRRFNAMKDADRGTVIFRYQHNNDSMETVVSEFIPNNRIYMLPQAKNGKKVLEYYSSDFAPVRPAGQGSEFFLKPNGSGHDKVIRSYLNGVVVCIAKHPAAINVVRNFTV